MLYFSAFQSHLWNLVLARWLENQVGPEALVPVRLKLGTFPFLRALAIGQLEELRKASLPLPCARSPEPVGAIGDAVAAVLGPLHLDWRALRIKHLPDIFLSKGSRPCLYFPGEISADPEPDDLYPNHRALRLRFTLPRGSYATILVKRITDAAERSP